MSEKFEFPNKSTEQIQNIAFKDDLVLEAGFFSIIWIEKLVYKFSHLDRSYKFKDDKGTEYYVEIFNRLYANLVLAAKNNNYSEVEDIIGHLISCYDSYIAQLKLGYASVRLILIESAMDQNMDVEKHEGIQVIDSNIELVNNFEKEVSDHLSTTKYLITGEEQYKIV